MLCTIVVHSDMHTRAVLKDEHWFRFSFFVHLFRFSILCVVCCSLDYFVLVLFAYNVLGLVSSVLCQEFVWEERIRNDLFLCRIGCKTLTKSQDCKNRLDPFPG